jgi:hypothetical protein
LGLTQVLARGSDGREFLDYGIEEPVSEIANIVRQVPGTVFGVRDFSDLEFRAHDFDPGRLTMRWRGRGTVMRSELRPNSMNVSTIRG